MNRPQFMMSEYSGDDRLILWRHGDYKYSIDRLLGSHVNQFKEIDRFESDYDDAVARFYETIRRGQDHVPCT